MDDNSVLSNDETKLIYGDPVAFLIESFNELFPSKPVRVAYMLNMEDWLDDLDREPSTYDSFKELQDDHNLLDETEFDRKMLDDTYWTTGALVAVIEKVDSSFILLDWESPPMQNVAILLDLLPKILSTRAFEIKRSRRLFKNLFDQLIQNYYKTEVPYILDRPDLMSVMHIPYEDLYEGEPEEDDDGDLLNC